MVKLHPQIYGFLGLRTLFSSSLAVLLLSTAAIMAASSASAQSVAIQINDSGQAVTELQQRLLDLGYYNGEITGFYGSMTQEAVTRFQQDMGLTADGVVGSATETALRNPTSVSPAALSQDASDTAPQSLVRLGDSGAQISELQRRLTDLGYYNASISGSFDAVTEAAVIRFQQDNNLPTDGIVGSATETALRQPVRPDASTASPSQGNPTPTDSTALLRLGSTGTAVSDLQARLTNLGFYQGAITGSYDTPTEAAVIAFQRSRNLIPDGIAGAQVATALGISAPTAGTGNNTQSWQQLQQARTEAQQAKAQAEQAQRDAEQARLEAEQARLILAQNLQEGRYSVAELQRYLQTNGYNPGDISGTLTPETRSAIAAAQQRYGLSDVDLFGATP